MAWIVVIEYQGHPPVWIAGPLLNFQRTLELSLLNTCAL